MKTGYGSRKGSAFERDICKKLSLWWSEGKRDDIFWRTASSGARATQRRKIGRSTYGGDGDICAIDPIGQPLLDKYVFSLKCGYTKDLDVISHIDSIKSCRLSKLMEFWEDIYNLAEIKKKKPALIIKRNNKVPIILVNQNYSIDNTIWISVETIFIYRLEDFMNDRILKSFKDEK